MARPSPNANEPDPLTPTEAAALISWLLACGARLRTEDVMQRTGLGYQGAYAMVCRISRVIPVEYDETSACWSADNHFSKHGRSRTQDADPME